METEMNKMKQINIVLSCTQPEPDIYVCQRPHFPSFDLPVPVARACWRNEQRRSVALAEVSAATRVIPSRLTAAEQIRYDDTIHVLQTKT